MTRLWLPIAMTVLALLGLVMPDVAFAQDLVDPAGDTTVELAEELRDMPVATSVRIIVLLTAMSLLPAMLVVMTPFTRFIVVFSMLRQALGLQQAPPNQVLVGLALFMSLLVMRPTVD